ncbi:alpha/beta fold hydrolase [Pigmentiphaga sp.]|jgi:Predicted hydrolases or acyltransferases (alpha/beta hydrolase superfamily)|uniref:alpha/beta fold hydrolase n=1 Tax=Pigmentiphaga sp. TaxID=1977564 RepID=UPI0025D1A72A|nr:alpha/beta hydrolase [Pigmentiphaga sp.]MBX6316980.1 alpha/beta hydrolase [Pigmentiphaga sp.]
MTAMDASTLRVRDTALRISRAGRGQPLLFLHGPAGLAESQPLVEALAAHYDCHAPEHPGYGGSPVPPWLDNVRDLANFYLDYLDQQKLSGVHLVGYDLGGWIAAELAVRNGHALASLTLISAQGIHVPGVPTIDVFLRTDEELVRDTYHDPALAEKVLERKPTEEELDLAVRNKEITARLTWQPRGHDPDLAKWLHRITVPTLVLWGANDRILPAEYGRSWRDRIARANLVELGECGHAPHLERTAETVAALTRFTASIGSPA